ncbi:MAG: response regulator transcription factor [Sphingomonadales bacterium]|nr:response regulator transcription factor [Sphingomonadales bacterium]
MRVLLIEDDAETSAFVLEGLGRLGHEVEVIADGAEGLQRALLNPPDLAIIDRMVPGLDGLSVVKALRRSGSETPVLLLTALGSVENRVEGLQGGADDYLVKPFSMAELAARLDALARRGGSAPPTRLILADLVLDRLHREVRRGGDLVELQPREFQLLELLLLHSPNVVTRAMLLDSVWRFGFDPGTNIVESHISRVRGKIDRGGDQPLIQTVRGEGYAARIT